MQSSNRPNLLYPKAERHYFYCGSNNSSLFCWQHLPAATQMYAHTIILCPPLGHEYTHAHRSLKHMAEYLATQGFSVIRFDYQGTGDSSDVDKNSDRIQTWVDNITDLVHCVKTQSPPHKISLLGLRLGATLACIAAQKLMDQSLGIDHLLLWEPIMKGRRYVREIKAISQVAAYTPANTEDNIESAGFVITPKTLATIQHIDLTQHSPCAKKSALIIKRNDRVPTAENFQPSSIEITELLLPGYAEMVEEPQATKVPFAAIEAIYTWLANQEKTQAINKSEIFPQKTSNFFPAGNIANCALEETAHWYKSDDFLFAIGTRTQQNLHTSLPAILLLNSGSAHHVGPNRIYIDIAHNLAEQGFYVLRMDFEGIGDSATALAGHENHPYQPNAVANVFAAMEFLQQQKIANTFIVGGICSGAYTAFHCALAEAEKTLGQSRIQAALLINPLTFYWQEGMSLSTTPESIQTIRDKNQYKKSLKDFNKWKKLLSGKVSFTYLTKFIFHLIQLKAEKLYCRCNELFLRKQKALSIDFEKLIRKNIPIHFIFSDSDPGLDLIVQDAKRRFAEGIRKKNFSLSIIDRADHTFSQSAMRTKLLTQLNHICTDIKRDRGCHD